MYVKNGKIIWDGRDPIDGYDSVVRADDPVITDIVKDWPREKLFQSTPHSKNRLAWEHKIGPGEWIHAKWGEVVKVVQDRKP